MKQLIFILSVFFLISCKKETMIKVYVENVATGEPYVNQLVYIRENPQNVQEEKKTVYEGVTDSDGRLLINLKCRRNAKYSILIDLPDSYCYIHSLGYPINIDKTNDIHFRLAPCAQLKFSYENVMCLGDDDYFEAHRYTNLDGYAGFTVNAVYEGCADFVMPNFVKVLMGWWFFEWKVIKNGQENNFIDSVFINDEEQKIYEINY